MSARTFSVGTDIGGTFTDMVVLDDQSVLRLFKLPTTPEDRSQGVIDGFKLAAEQYGMSLEDFTRAVRYFAHGTTAATNALIERKGSTTGLITTRGFADTLAVQRAMGSWTGLDSESGHYSRRRNPAPIVDRRHIVEVDERLGFGGTEVVALDHEQVRAAARQLREAGVEAVAICFLWAFVRPDHELAAAEVVREEWPEVFLTLSSDIAPVIGEYERTATAVVNSYLGPVINRYVGLLERRLRDNGFTGDFTVMDSAGGVMDSAQAADRAVELLASGPAGGVLASAALARRLGYPNVITSDMGGTSFDVGLIVDGEPLVATSSVDGGYHLAAPRIQITAVGSGGGSIAAVDEDGVLVVGPESAGAVPGPACYGRGGTRPTVTDADVTLGIIDPEYFLGGRIPLRRELAEEAIGKHVAEPLGLPVDEAAAGVRSVVDNQMADLLRTVTIQQGYDPRDFVLFAYGGAGPAHAYSFAREAGIDTIVVPYTATVNSAYGAVSSDRYRGVQISDPQRTPPRADRPAEFLDVERINRTFGELVERCRREMGDHPGLRTSRLLYFRFRKQTHELPILVPDRDLTPDDLDELVRQFHSRYERIYGEGTSLPEAGIEINTFRVEGRIPGDVSAASRDWSEEASTVDAARLGQRSVLFGRQRLDTAVYRGERLPRQADLAGPAILEFPGTTVVVGPDQHARVDGEGNIIITLTDASGAGAAR
ncbi:hydantoinase/oxoprolinase family protein [Phytohabitans kaempferiae]|uniref:Hydantoinase/oxoprolinase family protein n=1 Tax=Phytohabitans kaempferiae TaxID=1620943 RepID=A0ABV6LZB7_9ACTN